jgi:hypothetical protein
VAAPILRTCHAAERYSVKYYTTYDSSYKDAFAAMFTDASGFYPLPFMINAHAFLKMDTHGNHKTTYEKVPKPNPKFTGKTLFERLESYTPKASSSSCMRKSTFRSFIDIFNENCVFDGDTIEFMTQNFYKAKVDDVVSELTVSKDKLLESMNMFLKETKTHRDKGLFMYPTCNPGFVIHYTNPKNVTMFNNGTYHINITLPTLLGERDRTGIPRIVNLKKFEADHRQYIRYIQWLEPFIIAMYGTKDPLSAVSDRFSKGSQRCAVSRYIGIGTFNTSAEKMVTGKVVTVPIADIHGSGTDFWWYKVYHEKSGYVPLAELGMDISYRKHYNHGVEIRFLDWFPETMLKGLLTLYVRLADCSLANSELIEDPILNKGWNEFVVNMLENGKECKIPAETLAVYEKLFGCSLSSAFASASAEAGTSLEHAYYAIVGTLEEKYSNGQCSKLML